MDAPNAHPGFQIICKVCDQFGISFESAEGAPSSTPINAAIAAHAEDLGDLEAFRRLERGISSIPQHPAMHGIIRILLELDGEMVVKADVEIGYLHRAFEKDCEAGAYNNAIPTPTG